MAKAVIRDLVKAQKMDKDFMLGIIIEADRMGYFALRNDLIEDIKHELNDQELMFVMGLVHGSIQDL